MVSSSDSIFVGMIMSPGINIVGTLTTLPPENRENMYLENSHYPISHEQDTRVEICKASNSVGMATHCNLCFLLHPSMTVDMLQTFSFKIYNI